MAEKSPVGMRLDKMLKGSWTKAVERGMVVVVVVVEVLQGKS